MRKRKGRICLNRVKPFKPPQLEFQDELTLFSLVILWFSEYKHPFIDKPMAMTEPDVSSKRLLGLGLKLYHSNMPRMLNKDFTRFMQTPSEHQNRVSKRTALLAGWVNSG